MKHFAFAVASLALLPGAAAFPENTGNAAIMLRDGKGMPVDMPPAVVLFEGDFADMPERGEGGAKDLTRAMVYYKRAVARNYAMAGLDLAEMVWANPEVFPDKVKALAYCLWAEAQPPMSGGSDYDGDCALALGGLSSPEHAATRRIADGL